MHMNTIWKYVLQPQNLTIKIPKGATILTAREQNNEICIWAEVNPANMQKDYSFEIFGTGDKIITDNIGIERQYVGTAFINDGKFVFHVYYRNNI